MTAENRACSSRKKLFTFFLVAVLKVRTLYISIESEKIREKVYQPLSADVLISKGWQIRNKG